MTTENGYPAVRMHIAGEWCQGGTGRTAPIVNPATEEVIGEVPLATAADLDRALAAAAEGFKAWRDTPIARRTAILHAAADLLTERATEVGRIMTLEQGKPLAEAAGEARRVADTLRWHADDARRAYGRIIPSAPGTLLSVRREPIGTVAAFTPWNFPAGGPMRKISSALSMRLLHRHQGLGGDPRHRRMSWSAASWTPGSPPGCSTSSSANRPRCPPT